MLASVHVLPFIFAPLFFLFWIGFIVTIIVVSQKQMRRVTIGGRSYSNAEEFVGAVGPELGLWGTVNGTGPGPTPAHFSGTLADGTGAQVSFSCQGGKQPMYVAHLAVAAPAAPSLVVTRENGFGGLLARIGWKKRTSSGDRAFDGRYFLESEDPRAGNVLVRHEVRDEIDGAFLFQGVERLAFGKGSVVLTVNASQVLVDAYGQLLARIAQIAHLVDQRAVVVRLVGCERHEHARCGYCHANLSDEDTRVVSCDRCSTVVHDECWEELRHCPVAGCPGGAPLSPLRSAA